MDQSKPALSREDIQDNLNDELEKVYKFGTEKGLSESEIDQCFENIFPFESILSDDSNVHRNKQIAKPNVAHWLWLLVKLTFRCLIILLILAVVLFCVISHKPTQKFVTRHAQSYVYPVMRYLRLLTLPLLSKNHFLSQLHDEECLLRNPFYKLPLIDCWSCEDMRIIVDLTAHANLTTAYLGRGAPFITQETFDAKRLPSVPVTFAVLKKVYRQHTAALEHGTASVSSDDVSLNDLKQLFSLHDVPAAAHIIWKVKRVSAVQIIRTIFHRPYFVPSTVEVALQRFLFIDGAKFPAYTLPLTDFANVWIAQGSGYRQVTLIPSSSCRYRCHTVSILLKPGDILYYNWQFYNARTSAAKINNDPSVTLLGSFY